jgi:TrmH family RNA methyltransferase
MPPENITSLNNPKVKSLVRLRDRRAREESGLTVIDGTREISLALESGAKITELFVCRDFWQMQGEEDIVHKILTLKKPIYETTPAVFKKIAFGERQEGLLAVCQVPTYTFERLMDKKGSLYVVVDRVEKPGNLGAILRSCDAAGVDGVFVSDGKTDIYNPNVIRASIGTVFGLNILSAESQPIADFLNKQNIRIISAEPKARLTYSQIDWKGKVAIVVGSEQQGVSPFWHGQAGSRVRIPMLGKADSLNVSVATALLLYEAVRARQ